MRAGYVVILVFVVACSSVLGIDDPQLEPPDAAVCRMTPCDLAPQCGCGNGMACDLNSNDTGHLCRAAGTGMESTTCTADTQCAVGYTCAVRFGSGHCQKWCSADSDCDGPRGTCTDQLVSGAGGSGTPIPGAVICTSACDPLSTSNSQCPSGWGCDYFTLTYMSGTRDAVECRAPGTVAVGGSCSSSAGSCQAGLTCVHFTNGTDLCEHTCSPNTNTSCPNGSCHSFTTQFMVAGVEYGACW